MTEEQERAAFNAWADEFENFGTRYERLAYSEDLREALFAAFKAGYAAAPAAQPADLRKAAQDLVDVLDKNLRTLVRGCYGRSVVLQGWHADDVYPVLSRLRGVLAAAQAAAPAAQPEPLAANQRERWNIERDGDALLVCFNDHDKGQACRYERYIPEAAAPAAQPAHLTDAARDVLAERKRQIEKEGWTPEHDDAEHDEGDLAKAAACYALASNADEYWGTVYPNNKPIGGDVPPAPVQAEPVGYARSLAGHIVFNELYGTYAAASITNKRLSDKYGEAQRAVVPLYTAPPARDPAWVEEAMRLHDIVVNIGHSYVTTKDTKYFDEHWRALKALRKHLES